MKIITFEDNSQLDKSLSIIIDLALKTAGIQTLEHVNFILRSIQNITEQQVVEPELEPQPEPVVEPQS